MCSVRPDLVKAASIQSVDGAAEINPDPVTS
jgi:hypothetical protein